MTYLALAKILNYKVQRGQTSSQRLGHTQRTALPVNHAVSNKHNKDVGMRWVTGSVLYLWIFLMLHGLENRDTAVRTRKTRVSYSSLTASQSKQQWNFGRLDFLKPRPASRREQGGCSSGLESDLVQWAKWRPGWNVFSLKSFNHAKNPERKLSSI